MIARKSVGIHHSMCVQPAFIIGTYDKEGHANFAPITWVSITWNIDHYMLVISMFGSKKTKQNVMDTNRLSVNLVSRDMLPMMDQLGNRSAYNTEDKVMGYSYSEGAVVAVPTLDRSKWVYECEVQQTVKTGDSHTFFCSICNVQIDETIDISQGVDLTLFDPVVYSGDYHSIGNHLGKIGDFLNSNSNP